MKFDEDKYARTVRELEQMSTSPELIENAEEYFARALEWLLPNEEWSDDHLRETPQRFVRMLKELTTPPDIKWKTFPAPSDEMIVVSHINFVSLCAHHLVPFMGECHIAYIPTHEIAGLSKFARVVQHFAAGLQVQENLTAEIADYLEGALKPLGVGVIMEAEHLCMAIRGVKSPGAKTITSAMRGVFSDHTKTAKAEFLHFVNGGK
jgi:GTP cyclohydrolase IA